MDRLPVELVENVLFQCLDLAQRSKPGQFCQARSDFLRLRLVNRTFDSILRPYVCHKVNLDIPRLAKASRLQDRGATAFRSLQDTCDSLSIDLADLRDDDMTWLPFYFPPAKESIRKCTSLRQVNLLNPRTFMETSYGEILQAFLASCPQVRHVRLELPVPLLQDSEAGNGTATRILANAFKALATRPGPEGDDAEAVLETLVLEHVTPEILMPLFNNHMDIGHMLRTLGKLKHLSLSAQLQGPWMSSTDAQQFGVVYPLVALASGLESLHLSGTSRDAYHRLDTTTSTTERFRSRATLKEWMKIPPGLTSLHLADIKVEADWLEPSLRTIAPNLKHLVLDNVRLLGANDTPAPGPQYRWIGVPGAQPAANETWFATLLRQEAPNLQVCRAYNIHYGADDDDLDTSDPCGLDRTLGEVFSEIALGIAQPHDKETNQPVVYLSSGGEDLAAHPADGLRDEYRKVAAMAPEAVRDMWCARSLSIDGIFADVRNLAYREAVAQAAEDINTYLVEQEVGFSQVEEEEEDDEDAGEDGDEDGAEGLEYASDTEFIALSDFEDLA